MTVTPRPAPSRAVALLGTEEPVAPPRGLKRSRQELAGSGSAASSPSASDATPSRTACWHVTGAVSTVGLCHAAVLDQAVAVLHQGVGLEAELGFPALSLAVEPRLGISGALVRLVGQGLAVEVDVRVAPAPGVAWGCRAACRPWA